MTNLEMLTEFRNQVADTEGPYLWSDDEVLGYLISAQDTFVAKLGGIADSRTAAIVDIDVVTDEPYAEHSPYILRIMSGKLVTAKTVVSFVNQSDLAFIVNNDYGVQSTAALDDDDTGVVTTGIMGLTNNQIRWYKVPADDDTCRLSVFRLPYPRMTGWQNTDTQLEINEQYHRSLLLEMKHMAYSKQDAETYDKDAAEKNEAAFERACESAKRDSSRQRYKPRVVKYGGL